MTLGVSPRGQRLGGEAAKVAAGTVVGRPPRRRRRLSPALRDPCLWAGGALLATIVALAVLGGRLAPYDPQALSGPPLARPSAAHPLGTDDIGRDLLSQLLLGGRVALAVGAVAATLATALAWGLGLLAGLGPRWHAAVGGVADLFLALPFLPVAILVVAHLGPRPPVVAATLGLLAWPAFARVMRARVAAELAAGYVEAARALGARPRAILLRQVLPATVPVATAKFVLTAQAAIVAEASLAFLGLGDPTLTSWGGMIHRGAANGLVFASGAWRWWLAPPIAAIALLVAAVALLGWALDAAGTPARQSGRR
ncbi:MAG TPA: ABC transporter permease [Thermomicrobiales bacterium]|nr:ABC transporter permease [Thermomicrobiales bacterium]